MTNYEASQVPKRLSRIVLIKETSTLIFNDRFKIYFKHRYSFLLAWAVCKYVKNGDMYESMGGVPPTELQSICMELGYNATTGSINTRWYDEIRLKRNSKLIWHSYKVTDLKSGETITGDERFLVQILQLIFPEKITAPKGIGLSKNTKLYSVSATPDQIKLFATISEAVKAGFDKYGTSKFTRYRYDTGIVGFLDWRHDVYINSDGLADSKIYVKMINLSSVPISHYSVPLWSDSELTFSERRVRAYTKEDENIPIEVSLGGSNRSKRVEFVIFFSSPVDTGEIIEFFYTYSTPHAFEEGKEYFEWYFGQPHDYYQVEMEFDRVWNISDPVVFCNKDLDWFHVEQLSKQRLKWIRYFPKLHAKYKIEFVLTCAK